MVWDSKRLGAADKEGEEDVAKEEALQALWDQRWGSAS
jgi:hypothetical protein